MSAFSRALAPHRRSSAGRRFLFVPYDQLTDEVGPLATEEPSELGIVLVECPAKAARRPYHKQKLALVLANLRHFALEQAARGVAVRHVVAPSYAAAIDGLVGELGPMRMMRPAERELRVELAPLVSARKLVEIDNECWLTRREDLPGPGPWRMDAFYRGVRRRLGILMSGGKPVGGKLSFDTENRRAWPGSPSAPEPLAFSVDAITEEVCELVATKMADHPGSLRPSALPATRADAERCWAWAKQHCLALFGPFEDAMSTRSRGLFHTRISALLNLGRLQAKRVVEDACAMDIPLASKEGFVRQILGWREFVRHVHEATDGFRRVRGEAQPVATRPSDGADGGSQLSVLGASRAVPPAYWGTRSGLRCLDEVVTAVWEEGYSHHITRLMVLANIATMLDVSPRDLTDWFWVAYTDAFDWVVEPNVHAMGTFGVGDLMTTKPYIAGSAYIDKMSDFCDECRFDPKKTCPLPSLYWAFLGRHRAALAHVDRMKLPLASEARRTDSQRKHDAGVFERVAAALDRGEALDAHVEKAR